VGDVCTLLLTPDMPETLTETWQITHNEGYPDLQEMVRSNGHDCDYEAITELLKNLSIYDLASRCSLAEIEYNRLMKSPFVDECIYIAGWCKLFDDGLSGCFGDWSSGLSETWQTTRDKAVFPVRTGRLHAPC